MKLLRPSLFFTAALLVVCCALYPAAVTLAARALAPDGAAGSLLRTGDTVRGSRLLGQTFAHPEAHPEYFWGRLSAASVDPATGFTVSGGTNRGPMHPALVDDARARLAALRATGVTGAVPVDLVTASASGLDPHISPAAARVQIARVARARGLSVGTITDLVDAHTERPFAGLLGEDRVNVLVLNLALDALR